MKAARIFLPEPQRFSIEKKIMTWEVSFASGTWIFFKGDCCGYLRTLDIDCPLI